MNLDPRFSTAVEWCNDMVSELETFGTAPILQDENQWKRWAETICQFPGIARLTPPNPVVFDDWQEWAIRFNQCVLLPG